MVMKNIKEVARDLSEEVKEVSNDVSYKNRIKKQQKSDNLSGSSRLGHGIDAVKDNKVTNAATYETNKEKIKNSNNTIGERIDVGVSAVRDKIKEKSHKTKAKAHKEAL